MRHPVHIVKRHSYATIRLMLCLLLITTATHALADEEKRDTLVLRSGEILTGKIMEFRLGKLSIDSNNAGLLSIKTSKILTINSYIDSMRVETVNKEVWYGVLKPSPDRGMVHVVTATDTHLISISNISMMTPIKKSILKSLNGNLSLGFTYAHSSGIGQLSGNSQINLYTKNFYFSLTGMELASIDTAVFSRDREEVSLSGYYNLRKLKLWYLYGAFDYQRNLELSIARRFQQVAGFGRKFLISNDIEILTLTGISANQERSTTGVNENLLFEIPVGVVFNFYKFSHPNIQITSQNGFFISLSQKGRVRYDMNTTLSWELIQDFSFSLNFYYSYDRQPPDPTAGKNDYGTVIGLTYKF